MTRPDSNTPSVTSSSDQVQGLLRRLDDHAAVVPPAGDEALGRVEATAADHAESLRTTLAAQHEAQQLLAMATKVRGEASEQAEMIIREAQVAAEQLREQAVHFAEGKREQTTAWAREQRKSVDGVVAEIVGAAQQQADEIRANAEANAMVEAERAARQYVAQAAVNGARDAEAIRARAREVLERSASAVTFALTSMRGFSDQILRFAEDMQAQAAELEAVLADARETPTTARLESLEVRDAFAPAPEVLREPAPVPVAVEVVEPEPVAHEVVVGALPDGNPAFEQGRPLGSLFRSPRSARAHDDQKDS